LDRFADHYAILGVTNGASPESIEGASEHKISEAKAFRCL
jgi:hypothetical protein